MDIQQATLFGKHLSDVLSPDVFDEANRKFSEMTDAEFEDYLDEVFGKSEADKTFNEVLNYQTQKHILLGGEK